MRLKSVAMKGFKSFPERTRLDFGPGVSVVVGPNGSGKSNVTDAVLWAMGEQSPLAVRGQSMQDVIFGGGHGVQARSAAEVEIVLDNSDGTVDLPLSEISIVRRLDRSGEGGYLLNGARARLSDVIEVLSDTGLGKEQHSVISQGRVEAIVTSKARDRRLLIEEAAGLGKHRKRRRRAQLKLERTQENLDRVLDVEREARTRLRPLKRQAEAAQLHGRLERQLLEARLQIARDSSRARAVELAEAERRTSEARRRRTEIDERLQAIAERRGVAERALGERTEQHDSLARRLYEARSAGERLRMRAEQASANAEALEQRLARTELELTRLGESGSDGEQARAQEAGEARIAVLSAELVEIDATQERERGEELEELNATRERQAAVVSERSAELEAARRERMRADELVEKAREGSVWTTTWDEVRRVIVDGVERMLSLAGESERRAAVEEVAARAEHVARGVVEYALKGVRAAEEVRERAQAALLEAERRHSEAGEQQRRTEWLISQRAGAPAEGPLAVRRAELRGELATERQLSERLALELAEHARRLESLRARRLADRALLELAGRLTAALAVASESLSGRSSALELELEGDRASGERMAAELRACAGEEAEIQAELRLAADRLTEVEVAAQRLRDQAADAEAELKGVSERLGVLSGDSATASEDGAGAVAGVADDAGEGALPALDEEQLKALLLRVERLERRREQLGPVNPLAGDEYAEAVAHVEEMETRREDLETALRELRGIIRDTDRQIEETFNETFQAAAQNFEDLVQDVFPGGAGRLRLVSEEQAPRKVLGGHDTAVGDGGGGVSGDGDAGEEEALAEDEPGRSEDRAGDGSELGQLGVEIEITPAGKSTKRLSLLSGGEKSMTALAFLFAVFLARPCPFYILDEVEAALDDLNLDRFLALLRRYSSRAQFIVITHQRRTMEAADWLYGVSMGADGVSKVISRRLPDDRAGAGEIAEVAEVA
jgi:chromosome segregation protein